MSRAIDLKRDFKGKAGKCAKEIIQWMLDHHLWQDSSVYANGKRYSCKKPDGHYDYRNLDDFDLEADKPIDGITDFSVVYAEDDIDPKSYLDYCGNFVSVSFEGPLYNIMNYYDDFSGDYDDKMQEELTELVKKYGKYYEMGNAWNLSLYDL